MLNGKFDHRRGLSAVVSSRWQVDALRALSKLTRAVGRIGRRTNRTAFRQLTVVASKRGKETGKHTPMTVTC